MTETNAGEAYQVEALRQRITDLSIVPDYKIDSAPEAVAANDQLGAIKKIGKDVEAAKRAELAPIAQQEKEIREKFRPLEALLEQAERTVKGALLGFQRAEQQRLADEQRARAAAAAAEQARLQEQARREREAAEAKAAKLREQGKDERAEAVLAVAEQNAAAKEQVAAVLPAATAVSTEPTKLAGLSVGTVWTGEVVNLRAAVLALAADETVDLGAILSIKPAGINALAKVYKDKLGAKYAGLRGVPVDRVGARAR